MRTSPPTRSIAPQSSFSSSFTRTCARSERPALISMLHSTCRAAHLIKIIEKEGHWAQHRIDSASRWTTPTSRRRFMGYVYKRGARLSLGYRDLNGKPKQVRAGLSVGDETKARAHLAAIEERIKAGLDPGDVI